jgi:hypothetical protein
MECCRSACTRLRRRFACERARPGLSRVSGTLARCVCEGYAVPDVPAFGRSGFIGLCWLRCVCSLTRVCACLFAWGLLELFGRLTCGLACGPSSWWWGCIGCWFAWRDRSCVRQLQGCFQRLLLLRAPFQLLAGGLFPDQQQVSVVVAWWRLVGKADTEALSPGREGVGVRHRERECTVRKKKGEREPGGRHRPAASQRFACVRSGASTQRWVQYAFC